MMDGSSVKELQARYGYGTGKDMDGNELAADSPDRFLYCTQTLWEWAEHQASEQRAEALLGSPRDEAKQRRNGSSATNGATEARKNAPPWNTDSDEAQAAPAPSTGDVSSLRARLEAHK